jgi:putative transposase
MIYREWLREGMAEDDLRRIRVHLEKERALGSVRFQCMVEKTLGHSVELRGRGRPRRAGLADAQDARPDLIPSVPF